MSDIVLGALHILYLIHMSTRTKDFFNSISLCLGMDLKKVKHICNVTSFISSGVGDTDPFLFVTKGLSLLPWSPYHSGSNRALMPVPSCCFGVGVMYFGWLRGLLVPGKGVDIYAICSLICTEMGNWRLVFASQKEAGLIYPGSSLLSKSTLQLFAHTGLQ